MLNEKGYLMSRFKEKLRSLENYKALQEHLPTDHSNRQSLTSYVESVVRPAGEPINVLDLGCGEAGSVDLFKSIAPAANWHGVDIEISPEVKKRTKEHDAIETFDGANLPYPDNFFDFIYCNQVLEHVRHPDRLMADVFRVLKPESKFAGAESYLEPFHSYSIFNFTPYGVVRVLEDNGLKIDELRPGADAPLLINRQLMNRPPPAPPPLEHKLPPPVLLPHGERFLSHACGAKLSQASVFRVFSVSCTSNSYKPQEPITPHFRPPYNWYAHTKSLETIFRAV